MVKLFPTFFITVSILLSNYYTTHSQVIAHEFNCFTVIVGKNATKDGAVLVAHNEDDYGDQILNTYLVPSLDHANNETITLKNGASLPQKKVTNHFLWLQLPGMEFSDSYLNEHGIVVASNQCQSREDTPELHDGGIGYWLRRIIAERATSAREAVLIAGKLIEQFGYSSSGRTYTIADPNEAWTLAAVHGKHWVAQRVPDDEVVVIPNYYTIKEIDLSDSANFLGCADLIDYAISRSWYDPEKDGPFNFREVYGNPGTNTHPHNINRMWRGVSCLSSDTWMLHDAFPYSFKPKQKVTLETLFSLLADHYEKTELDATISSENSHPHLSDVRPICCESSVYGCVAQLRNYMPKEIGCVLWIAPFRPCTQLYIPWYLGTVEVPQSYAIYDSYKTAINEHWSTPENFREAYPNHHYWEWVDYAKSIDASYNQSISSVMKEKAQTQKKILKETVKTEKKALNLYHHSVQETEKLLTDQLFNYLNEKRQ